MARTVCAQIAAPPSAKSSRSTEVMTACLTPISFTDWATRPGSNSSTSNGFPVSTLQNPQLRVQMLPRIMNVAVPSPQHSPMLGQWPLSQMVCSLCSETMLRTSRYASPVGSFTRSHLGLGTRTLGAPLELLGGVADMVQRSERNLHNPASSKPFEDHCAPQAYLK